MNTRPRAISYVLVCLMLMTVYGCGTARMYSGNRLDPNQVAFLKCNDVIRIGVFDGKMDSGWNYCGFNNQIEMLPGEHSIDVRYVFSDWNRTWFSDSIMRLTFTAKPGHRYMLKAEVSKGEKGPVWNPTVNDVVSGEIVSRCDLTYPRSK
jgi:hypothetical protein